MLELSSRSSLGCPMKDSLEGQDKGAGAGMIILGPGYLGTQSDWCSNLGHEVTWDRAIETGMVGLWHSVVQNL